jgi:hypothetical protein
MDHRSTILMLRIIACLVIAAAVGAFIAQLKSIPQLTGTALLTPLAIVAFGCGIAGILLGVAAALQQLQKPTEASPANLAQRQLIDLALKVEDLGASISRFTGLRESVVSPTAAASPVERSDRTEADAPKVVQSIFDEMRELILLPDDERKKRWLALQEQRKQTAIQSVSALIRNHQLDEAQKAIVELEKYWPEDPAIAPVRTELATAQAAAEAEAVGFAETQIESEMSMSHWDRAAELARELAADFPNNSKVLQLLNRVEREKGIYTEATVTRLYEEIRHDVERRIWRRAHLHSQKLLEDFPGHPRSELIRKQIQTIHENAEIEERQEQEMRIGELIRARRFREAVDLSENLLRNYPTSPQAEAIQKMLPRVRELAAESESKSPQPPPQ